MSSSKGGRPGRLLSLLRWSLSAAATVLWLTPALLLAPLRRSASVDLVKRWSRLQRKIFGIELEVIDENEGRYEAPPYLYLHLNQTSLSESFLIHDVLPTDFVVLMNVEYALIPWAGWVLWALGAVVIVRQWSRQARQAIDRVVRRLRKGKSFYMSIEGRRSSDGRLLPYKKGPVLAAIAGRATIVPIVIHGAREILPYGEWRVRPGPVKVVLCRTMATSDLTKEDRDTLIDRLRSQVEKERV